MVIQKNLMMKIAMNAFVEEMLNNIIKTTIQ